MQLSSPPGLTSHLRRLVLATSESIQFLDITSEVEDLVREASLRDGIVTIFSRHTTAAICIQEDEPLLLEDLVAFMHRSAPPELHYRHNDFRVRTVHMHDDESPNGHAHCLQLMLGASETIPVVDGKLELGTWQRIFVIELDGPRPRLGLENGREVVIQALGASD